LLKIESIQLGPLQTNCYVVRYENSAANAWVIDPGMQAEPLVEYLRVNSLNPDRILVTHGHGDHIGGIGTVKKYFPEATICCPAGEEEMLTDPEKNMSGRFTSGIVSPKAEQLLSPGDEIHFHEHQATWQVLDTSGHTTGGISLYSPADGVVFTGDALFYRSVGRTDIPGGNHEKLIVNITDNLLSLPDETRVYPGHGPATTIRNERAYNPFLR